MPKFDIPEIPAELVDESKRVSRKVWAREDLDLRDPALMLSWGGYQGYTHSRDPWPQEDPRYSEEDLKYRNTHTSERINNPEVDVRSQLITIRSTVEHMKAGKDAGVPIALFPALHMVHFGTGPLATAFGSKWIIRENDQPFFEPAIHTPEDALRLRKPDLLRDGMLPRIYERIEYYNEATKGKIPICVCDTAGPWSIATQIWHFEEMLEGIITAPEAVHYVLDLVTECMIEFDNMQITRMANWYGNTDTVPHFFRPRGMYIGDDTMVAVSPGTWEEFFLPYNNRISREYGGALYHCCMRYDTHFQSLIKTENFMGFDATPEYNDLDKVEAALAGRGVWCVVLGDVPLHRHGETGRRNDLPTIRRLRGKVPFYLGVHGDNRQDAIDRAKRLLDELG